MSINKTATSRPYAELSSRLAEYTPRPLLVKICVRVVIPSGKSSDSTEKQTLSRSVRTRCEQDHGITHDHLSDFVLDLDVEKDSKIVSFDLKHVPLKVFGVYFKDSRVYSQTPMMVDHGLRRVGEGSVQETIQAPLVRDCYPGGERAAVLFGAAGREDVDVRVLGRGRQFILSLVDPKILPQGVGVYERWEREINTKNKSPVRVRGLRLATEQDRLDLLDGEARMKLYACVVEVANSTIPDINPVDGLRDLIIYQKTPVRVSHRRAMMTREKTVYKTTCVTISPTLFILWIQTSGGCYIKEFVHSDCGRTIPSVSSMLGASARLLSLDYFGSTKDNFDDIQLVSGHDT